MTTSHVISGLIAKRAEVAGQIAHLNEESRRLKAALEHLDATIVFLDPSIKPTGILSRRVPRQPPVLPELARTVLDLMRTATQPMTTREMALRLLQEHNLDRADLARLEQAVGGCMNRADGRLVEPVSRRKRPMRWRLVG
jgi:hypothetical protein